MNYKTTIIGTIAYSLVTFPLAIIWHILLFEATYRSFGYFEGEPDFLLGLATIVIQGFILSFLFPFVKFSGKAIHRGLKYSLLMGSFFWTSQVLAFVAKQVVANSTLFILMESVYLLLQFGLYGLLMGIIHKNKLM